MREANQTHFSLPSPTLSQILCFTDLRLSKLEEMSETNPSFTHEGPGAPRCGERPPSCAASRRRAHDPHCPEPCFELPDCPARPSCLGWCLRAGTGAEGEWRPARVTSESPPESTCSHFTKGPHEEVQGPGLKRGLSVWKSDAPPPTPRPQPPRKVDGP